MFLPTIKRLIVFISLVWLFRKTIWHFLGDYPKLLKYSQAVNQAYEDGVLASRDAQYGLSRLLGLRSFSSFVEATKTVTDDDALRSLRRFVEDKDIFEVAWKIVCGNWGVGVEQSRWGRLIDKIKALNPFVDKAKAGKQLAVFDGPEVVTSDAAEVGVVELVSVIMLILGVLPKVLAIVKSTRSEQKT